MEIDMPAGVILCCGASKRFGGEDKLLYNYMGKPLCLHVFDTVRSCGFADTVVVTNSPEIGDLARGRGFDAVANPQCADGISTSIRAAVRAREESRGWMFFVGDQPGIRRETVQGLCRVFSREGKVTVPVFGEVMGNPCIFPASFRTELLSLEGDTGGKSIIRRLPTCELSLFAVQNPGELRDIDTKEDISI